MLNFPIALDAFLSSGAAFNISISSATLTNPLGTHIQWHTQCMAEHVTPSLVVSDSAPEISDVFGSTTATITEQVANPLVGFEDTSIEASVNDGMHCKMMNILYLDHCSC